MNKPAWVFVAFLILTVISEGFAQEKKRVYEVPPEYVSVLLVSDPDCPLQLSNPRFLKYEKGTFEKVYSLANVSDKPVIRFQIKELSWLGGQESTKNSTLVKGQKFLPQENFSTLSNEDQLEFLEFNEKVFRDQELRTRPKDIWIVIVTKVEMADGTIYDISSKYEDVERFVKKLGITSDRSYTDILAKESELQEFISKKFARY